MKCNAGAEGTWMIMQEKHTHTHTHTPTYVQDSVRVLDVEHTLQVFVLQWPEQFSLMPQQGALAKRNWAFGQQRTDMHTHADTVVNATTGVYCRQTDRQTDRQTGRQAGRQIVAPACMHAYTGRGVAAWFWAACSIGG